MRSRPGDAGEVMQPGCINRLESRKRVLTRNKKAPAEARAKTELSNRS